MKEGLLDQFQKSVSLVRFTIEKFDDEQWFSSISWFQTPARGGDHLIESLDFYFPGIRDHQKLVNGFSLGGPWWEMNEEQLPDKEALLEYLEEVKERIEGAFPSIDDKELSASLGLYN